MPRPEGRPAANLATVGIIETPACKCFIEPVFEGRERENLGRKKKILCPSVLGGNVFGVGKRRLSESRNPPTSE